MPGYGLIAYGAMRRWINYRLSQGKPVNADIQETSDKRAENKNKDIAGHKFS